MTQPREGTHHPDVVGLGGFESFPDRPDLGGHLSRLGGGVRSPETGTGSSGQLIDAHSR